MVFTMNTSLNETKCPLSGIFDDTSNLADPRLAVKWLYTSTDMFLLKVVIPLISSAGIIGNGAFLFMVLRVAALKSTLTLYLVNLAICDILYLLFLDMVYFREGQISSAFYVNSVWECAALAVYVNWWYCASTAFVTLISVERYFAICKPLKAMILQGRRRNIKMILMVWSVSLLMTMTTIPQFVKFRQYCVIWPDAEAFRHLPNKYNRCQYISPFADNYSNFLSISVFVVTATVNAVIYAQIIYTLSQRNVGNAPMAPAERARNQVARTLVANGILFFISQTPYRVYTLADFLANLGFPIDPFMKSKLFYIGGIFLLLNSIINPYLYVLTCAHYRKCMIKAFCNLRSSTSDKKRGTSLATVTSCDGSGKVGANPISRNTIKAPSTGSAQPV